MRLFGRYLFSFFLMGAGDNSRFIIQASKASPKVGKLALNSLHILFEKYFTSLFVFISKSLWFVLCPHPINDRPGLFIFVALYDIQAGTTSVETGCRVINLLQDRIMNAFQLRVTFSSLLIGLLFK